MILMNQHPKPHSFINNTVSQAKPLPEADELAFQAKPMPMADKMASLLQAHVY